MLDFPPNSAIFKTIGCCPVCQVELAPRKPREMAWHSQGPSCQCRPSYLKRKRKNLLHGFKRCLQLKQVLNHIEIPVCVKRAGKQHCQERFVIMIHTMPRKMSVHSSVRSLVFELSYIVSSPQWAQTDTLTVEGGTEGERVPAYQLVLVQPQKLHSQQVKKHSPTGSLA